MKYITGKTNYCIKNDTAISLGKFDGIHMGHKCLINNILSKKDKYKTVIYTFDMNPASKVSGNREQLLTTNYERKQLLTDMGIDYLIECPFTDETRNLEAEAFIRKIVRELSIKYIAVGKDYRFGHNRVGDYKMLTSMAEELGYEIVVFEKEQYEGRDISSTYIREEILDGNLELANKLLGYSYIVGGIAEHDRNVGKTIEIPITKVIPPDNKLMPPNGVYVSKVVINNNVYSGVTNIGIKPNGCNENKLCAETFIIDFDSDVYGKKIIIELISFIRTEIIFNTISDFKIQMKKDIEFTKSYIG